jgi:hypothetical protein
MSSPSSSLSSSSSRLSESRRLREALAEHSETLAGIERGISVSKEEEERERTLIGFKLAAAAAAS